MTTDRTKQLKTINMDAYSSCLDKSLPMPLWALILIAALIIVADNLLWYWPAIKKCISLFCSSYLDYKHKSAEKAFEAREKKSIRSLDRGFYVVEQIYNQHNFKFPFELWKVRNVYDKTYIDAIPIHGYVPIKGDEVLLTSWTTRRFDRKNPSVVYFISFHSHERHHANDSC